MPIYEFRCRDCGKVVEMRTSISTASNVRCPECGSEALERLVSVFHTVSGNSRQAGRTCCGRTERCDMPPCSEGGTCYRG